MEKHIDNHIELTERERSELTRCESYIRKAIRQRFTEYPHDVIEDLQQAGLLAAARHIGKRKPGYRLEQWLVRSAVWGAQQYVRDNVYWFKWRPEYKDERPAVVNVNDDANTAIEPDWQEAVDVRVTVQDAVEHLKPRQRAIADMRFGKQMTQEEIGRQLGIDQATVYRELATMGKVLRKELAGLGVSA